MLNNTEYKRLGAKLKALRLERDLTQAEVAKLVNCTRVSISRYESGKRYPRVDILWDLAKLYNVDMVYLLGNCDEKPIDLYSIFKRDTICYNGKLLNENFVKWLYVSLEKYWSGN